jgi:hypothetical protein
MKKSVLFVIAITMILCFLISHVNADGGMVIYDPDMAFWRTLQEDSQFAFINYQNGIEKMILNVNIEEQQGTQAVWIFPVPAPHEQTQIDILRETPVLLGTPVEKKTKDALSASLLLMSATQIYPLPVLFLYFVMFRFTSMSMSADGMKGMEQNFYSDVKIYEYIREGGVTTQLVTAKTADSLAAYVSSKSLVFPDNLRSTLDEYINEDSCFVITWISDFEEFKKYSRPSYNYRYSEVSDVYPLGVYVEFPTEDIYFPLKPTSMYEDKVIPINIYVMGHVTPKLYPEIQEKTTIDYYYGGNRYNSENLTRFFGNTESSKYTKIRIEVPSNELTQDLIIKNEVPKKIKVHEAIQKNTILLSLALFALLSCLSSLTAGLISFRKQKPSIVKFFFFGLLNFLTFLGLSIAACLFKIDERFIRIKEKRGNISVKRVLIKTLIICLIISGVLFFLFSLSFMGYMTHNPLAVLYLLFFTLIIFLIIGVIFFLFLGPLIYAGYKNKRLLGFLICFSLVFIILLLISGAIISYLIL